MKKSILLIAALIALLAVTLVACGGKNDGMVSENNSTRNNTTDVGDRLGNAAEDVGDGVGGAVTGAGELVGDAVTGAGDIAGEVITGAGDAVSDVVS